jgi:hypothetical protein
VTPASIRDNVMPLLSMKKFAYAWNRKSEEQRRRGGLHDQSLSSD